MAIQIESQKVDKNVVRFRAKEGVELAAQLKRANKKTIAFEHVVPSPLFSTDELIDEIAVEFGGEVAFQGRARVSSVTNLGGSIVYEAQLDGQQVAPRYSADAFLENAVDLLEEHTAEWTKAREVEPSFRLAVADLESYLEGLESWCQQVEDGILADLGNDETAFLERVGPVVSLEIASHFAEYERQVGQLAGEQRAFHREHLKRALHRFILQSPFSQRCFQKPLGYAGDYGMVELMLGNPYQGETLFGKLLNNAFLETGPVQAHQNRIVYLVEQLKGVVAPRAAAGKRTRILNLGCGPADEVRRFIETEAIAETCDFELLDFSDVTLKYTSGKIAESCERAGREVPVTFIEQSIQGFLRQAGRGVDFEADSYDLVYCAGLFDYLSQGFCAKLTSTFYDLAKPGGRVVVTNVSKHNTIPFVMEDFLEWEIIDRTEDEMMELVPDRKSSLLKDLKSDITRINLFLELQKSVAHSSDVGATEKTDANPDSRQGVPGEVRGGRSD